MVQYMYHEVVLYTWLCKILTIIINIFIFVSIPEFLNKQGARLAKANSYELADI
jgi:hypothetical protein